MDRHNIADNENEWVDVGNNKHEYREMEIGGEIGRDIRRWIDRKIDREVEDGWRER